MLRKMMMTKAGGVLLVAMGHVWADGIEVDFETTLGTVTVEMEHEVAPLAVSNLMTLATAQKAWLNRATGEVKTGAIFNGQVLVGSEDGSRLELGAGLPPGYLFPDELSGELKHDGYVLAMSNDGPNTNSAAIYFTGSASQPDRDGRHTVFGSIEEESSRAVIDALLVTPGASVVSVNVRRVDLTLEEFNEDETNLPWVEVLSPKLSDNKEGMMAAQIDLDEGSELVIHRSSDLKTWEAMPGFYRGPGDDEVSLVELEEPVEGAAFFRFSVVHSPGAIGISEWSGRFLVIASEEVGRLEYEFDETGAGGTYRNVIPDPVLGDFVLFQGKFTRLADPADRTGAYGFAMLLSHFDDSLGGSPFIKITGSFDHAEPDLLSGRHRSVLMAEDMSENFTTTGSLELSP